MSLPSNARTKKPTNINFLVDEIYYNFSQDNERLQICKIRKRRMGTLKLNERLAKSFVLSDIPFYDNYFLYIPVVIVLYSFEVWLYNANLYKYSIYINFFTNFLIFDSFNIVYVDVSNSCNYPQNVMSIFW